LLSSRILERERFPQDGPEFTGIPMDSLFAPELLAHHDLGMSASAATGVTASPWVPVIAAAVGAGAALAVGILTQLLTGSRENLRWSREREDRKEQWQRERQDRLDDSLRELCSDFAAAARELLHLSRRLERSSDKKAQRGRIDDTHLRLRSLNEQIRLLANHEVQRTAQFVVHHGYAVRAVIAEKKSDKRFAEYGKPVEPRYRDAIRDFYEASRKQLGVPKPEELVPFEVAAGDPWPSLPSCREAPAPP
jgi:hypothetical protein